MVVQILGDPLFRLISSSGYDQAALQREFGEFRQVDLSHRPVSAIRAISGVLF